MVDFRYKHLKILALTSLFSVNASVKFDNSVDLPHRQDVRLYLLKFLRNWRTLTRRCYRSESIIINDTVVRINICKSMDINSGNVF